MFKLSISLIVSFIFLVGCSKDQKLEKPIIVYDIPRFNAKPEFFSSCSELKSWLAEKEALYKYEQKRYWDWLGGQPMPVYMADGASQQNSASVTNIQEADVDEPDHVKASRTQIFHARTNSIKIFDKDDLSFLGTIDYPRGELKLLLQGDDLVVLHTLNNKFSIFVYSVSSGKMPVVRSQYSYDGVYRDARLKSGQLIVVGQDRLSPVYNLSSSSNYGRRQCKNIRKPFVDGFDQTLTEVISVKLSDLTESITAQVGAIEQIYMGSSLYLVRTGTSYREWFYWDERLRQQENDFDKAIVAKYSLDGETPKQTHAGQVKGRVYSQWAMKEDRERDLFFVATTIDEFTQGWEGINNSLLPPPRETYNQLWALGEDGGEELVIKGLSPQFGQTEDIRAVRYVDDKAYVVTFKKTDPVFAIDLAQLPSLPIEGELHIPGFSAYLHPLSGDRLLGMGYDAIDMGDFAWFQGPQLSLFDVSDPENLLRTDFVTLGDRGSHIDVVADHHAFYYDEERQLASFSARLFEYSQSKPDNWSSADQLTFSGLMVYSLDGGFGEKARISHSALVPQQCQETLQQAQWWQSSRQSVDIQRSFVSGEKLYVISPFAVEFYDINNLSQSGTRHVYSDNVSECERILPGGGGFTALFPRTGD